MAEEHGVPFDDEHPARERGSGTPFDSIEGALEYVTMLAEAVAEAEAAIQEDIGEARAQAAARRVEALHIVAFKLDKLRIHIGSSRRILNDLRTLRRLLLDERQER